MIPNLHIPQSENGTLSPFSSNALETHALAEVFDLFSTDQFRMYQFKVRECPRGRSHDWTECPYAHPAEKARRRDPRKYHYSGTACPDYRKGNCKKGDTCQFAHGVFECWLHPSRYRTQLCKDRTGCRRRVCFFAHTTDQLRSLSPEPFVSSPTSVINSSFSESPPASPGNSRYRALPVSVRELVNSMRNVQLEEGASSRCVFGSPRGGFLSLNGWEEEPAMERVESGRDLRAKIYAKLSRENSIGPFSTPAPDIGWVSELVK
ncbi:zinc finger CCCH domain-containing protein 20-like [Abrus precatorius]|uniref:Zinc finger CCCH domain-containing protein 20-like n=1 Tax=Abrus precatorius TaxID=3816 RepID=A0A8B8LLI6_ABRPR|nr:zinc finger CCCH domain-containing protein 20-like [Abrus precatorius]